MEGLQNTTTRLRKTFHYPTDDSSNDSPDVLDEEEQDNLIQSLCDHNEARNSQFRIVLLALPALAAIPYLLTLARPSMFLLSVLSLTSLGSTAWLLHTQEPTETGIPALDAWARRRTSHHPAPSSAGASSGAATADTRQGTSALSSASSSAADIRHFASSSSGGAPNRGGSSRLNPQQQQRRRRLSSFSLPSGLSQGQHAHRSPLEAHLPLLNAGLCGVLALMGLVIVARGGGSGSGNGGGRMGGGADKGVVAYSSLALLPAVIYFVTLAAKVVMAGVDPEAELGELKYEYKGA